MKWLKENWLNFIINFIGIWIILFAISNILFELQTPDLLYSPSVEQLQNYTETLALRAERQSNFLWSYLPFASFFFTVGVYLFRFKKSKVG